ncbi:MAG TPA: hypothetical protein G4N98_10230 [Thermoflexia bacterium]|nr:hypothetical protein [Thermoflexia bacterium]
MKAKNWRTRRLSKATPELGYQEVNPPATQSVTTPPSWVQLEAPGPNYAALRELIAAEQWPVAVIRDYISATGTKPYGRSRAALAQQLAESFLDAERLQAAQQALSADTREIYLAMLVSFSLPRPRENLYVLHAPPRPMQEYYRELEEAGLLLRRPDKLLLPNLYTAPPAPLHFPHDWEATEPAARREVAAPQRVLTRIQQVLGLVRGGDVQLSTQYQYNAQIWPLNYLLRGGLPAPASVVKLGMQRTAINPNKPLVLKMLPPAPALVGASLDSWMAALSLPQDGVEFFYHLLVAARILRPGSPVTLEPQYERQFFSLAPGKQLAVLLHSFEEILDWQVFWPRWREGQVRATWTYSGTSSMSIDYQQELAGLIRILRSAFLCFLAALPQERWLSVAKVAEMLTRYLPPEYFFDQGLLSYGDRRGNKEWFLQLYLHTLLRGPLHWLGLVDLEFAADGALLNFRLQHLQDLLWRRLETFPLPEFTWSGESGVQWDAQTKTLQLQLPAPPVLLGHVQRWAEPQGVGAETLRYRPAEERLHALFEQGVTLADLVADWEAAAGAVPPSPLRAWWQQWWERYGHVRLYPGQTILVTEDKFALQELQAALPKFQDAILGMINSRVVLLRSERSAEIVGEMEEKGYLPKVLGG